LAKCIFYEKKITAVHRLYEAIQEIKWKNRTQTKKENDPTTFAGDRFIKSCKAPKTPYSSRQVRVLEVCQQEESQCEPLLACLDNLNKK